MLTIKYHTSFKKDYKRVCKRGYNPKLLEEVITILVKGETLPVKYKDHQLTGNYKHCRECHITPDWLLIYEINKNALILYLAKTQDRAHTPRGSCLVSGTRVPKK